ncbi:thioester reductase domain-containing protein [Phormidesmis priestleyi]
MTNLSSRIANLSPEQRQRLVQRLQEKTGATRRIASPTAVDLKTEAILDSTISPEGKPVETTPHPRSIFFTGATGFLGAFLLVELLRQTSATFYCLVRAGSLEVGKQRIQQNLKEYGIWHDRFSSRIIPVLGDLEQPQLGISTELWETLSANIDVIYHNAASLNFVFPYSVLKPMNVLGTQEVLRLACQTKVKRLHYASTYAVFESPDYAEKVVSEADPVDHSEGIALGYTQTKWVAEKLVQSARSRGLPVCIYRLPLISGHSKTGAWNLKDFTCLMIKGCTQMKCWPTLDSLISMSPVDYTAEAIAYLSQQPNALGQTFHLTNPNPVHVNEVQQQSQSQQNPIEYLPYDQWQARLVEVTRSQDNALSTLKPFFLEPWTDEQLTIPEMYQRSRTPILDCQATLKALAGTSIVCPRFDRKLMTTYLFYFIQTNFLDAETIGRSQFFWIKLLLPFYRLKQWFRS